MLALLLATAMLTVPAAMTSGAAGPGELVQSASAQEMRAQAPPSDGSESLQTGCPIVFTRAILEGPAAAQTVAAEADDQGDTKANHVLRVRFRNAAGKDVTSFRIGAEFVPGKVSPQPPVLRAPKDIAQFHESEPVKAKTSGNAHWEVKGDVRGLLMVRLEAVLFADGSRWKPGGSAGDEGNPGSPTPPLSVPPGASPPAPSTTRPDSDSGTASVCEFRPRGHVMLSGEK